MENTIHITEDSILQNLYYLQNQCMFMLLIELIKNYKHIRTMIRRPKYSLLNEWINKSLPLLASDEYNILTKIYWIVYGIKDWSDKRIICPYCNKPFMHKNIYRLRCGYSAYCSIACLNKSLQHIHKVLTAYNNHKAEDPEFTTNIVKRSHETRVRNGHSPTWTNSEKCKQTKLERYNDATYCNVEKARETRQKLYNGWHSPESRERGRLTCYKHFGFECALAKNGKRDTFDLEAIRQKALLTMKLRHTYKTSKEEEHAFTLLCSKFGKDNVLRQYKTTEYPYCCDFFIKPLQLYIEYNGSWTHGKHAYDPNSEEDARFLHKWQMKCKERLHKKHNYYERAIYVWTVLDVKKRATAKQNKLNFLEIWTIALFKTWLLSVQYT